MDARQHSNGDARAFDALREQLGSLLADTPPPSQEPATSAREPHTQAGENSTMPLQAGNIDGFETLVQQQLARIGAQLEALGRRLDEERGFAPQRPEEVPGYAELKTALHNLVEHLELAEGRTAEAIGNLHDKLEELSSRTAQALQMAQQRGGDAGRSLKELEERIDALNARLEELRHNTEQGARAYVDSCIGELQRRLEAVESAPTGGMSADDIARMIDEQVQARTAHQAQDTEERMSALVARLQGKLEDLAAGVMDVDRLRTDVEQLDARVRELAGQLAGKADRAETRDLKERLDALAAQLEAAHGGAPADDARLHALEEQVLQIRELVEEALGEPLAMIGDKLAAHDEQLARLQQGGVAEERLARLEQAIASLQQALQQKGSAEAGDGEDVAALKAGLEDLERYTRETDARTREMLQAVHETLAEVVDRLIALEDGVADRLLDGRRDRDADTSSATAGDAADAGDVAASLLGEPAPAESAAPAPEPARAAKAAADGDDGTPARHHDLASEVAQVIATLQPQKGGDAGATHPPRASRDENREKASAGGDDVDDFIAAARRAALAAATAGDARQQVQRNGGLLARLGALVRRTPRDGQDPAGDDIATAAGDASQDNDAPSHDEEPARRAPSLLAGLMGRRGDGDAGDERQAQASAARPAQGKAAGNSRTRLLLAGLVLLSAAAVIINRQQPPQQSADTTPAAVQATTEDTGTAGPDGANAHATTPPQDDTQQAAAPSGQDAAGDAHGATGTPGTSPQPGRQSTGDGTTSGKDANATDRQASLSSTPGTGLFAPRGAGMPITTASIGAIAATARDIGTRAPAASGRPGDAASTPQHHSLPESIGPAALRAAALNGDGKAAYVVATRYLKGEGVPRDAAAAARWLRKAADRGVVVAMYRLGTLHERGLGLGKDLLQARVWYERAALRGNVRAMHNLAVLLASGSLGKEEFDKAAYWFRKAATHGVRDSQFNLAVLHHRGQGVPRSLAEAWFWYSVAARQGDTAAAEQAARLAAWLPPAEMAAMQQRLADFRPTPPIRNANAVVIDRPEWRADPAARTTAADTPSAAASQQSAATHLKGRALVAEVQRLLKRIGYDVGPVDGIMGNRTANAIRLFQLQSRLPVNGKPDHALLEQLRRQVQAGLT